MKMNAALYFPFIRGRDGELQALSSLSPIARARMVPVVDMPTPKENASLSTDVQINLFVSRTVKAWGTQYPVYLDMSRFPSDVVNSRGMPAVEHMFACAAQLKALAIPVTGPLAERGPGSQYLDAITRIAARDGRGAAFRVAHEDFSDADVLRRELNSGLTQLKLSANQIDVFLDAGGVEFLPEKAGVGAALFDDVRQAAEVCRPFGFRKVVFIASSVPEDLSESSLDKPMQILRHEFRIWKRLAIEGTNPLIRFGDSCVWSPRQPDSGGGGGGPPPARVRFPVGDTQIFLRAPSSTYREVCLAATQFPGFAHLPRCSGVDEIKRCAKGSGAESSASTWVARDTNLHMEATVRQVQDFLERCARINEISLAAVDTQPWQQESLPDIE